MEGKLFKMVEGYTLSLTGSIDDLYGISDKQLAEDHQLHKLSLKNCEDVANGYDLVELFDEVDESIDYQEFDISSFKLGFKKAIEILGDKKFSEEDMKKAIHFGASWREQLFNGTTKTSELFESLQQTEWDVIIEMECPVCKEWGYISECRNNCNQKFLQPKLDADGCLILRRI